VLAHINLPSCLVIELNAYFQWAQNYQLAQTLGHGALLQLRQWVSDHEFRQRFNRQAGLAAAHLEPRAAHRPAAGRSSLGINPLSGTPSSKTERSWWRRIFSNSDR
jgi:hypothetical protein